MKADTLYACAWPMRESVATTVAILSVPFLRLLLLLLFFIMTVIVTNVIALNVILLEVAVHFQLSYNYETGCFDRPCCLSISFSLHGSLDQHSRCSVAILFGAD